MKKIKKIIPFFVILISAIFLKTGNVFADDSIQVIPYPSSVVSALLKQGSTKSLDFIYNNTSTYKYTNMALNFINNGKYKNYGKYYFYDHWGSDVPLVYVTDYPEVLTIIAYDEDDSKGKTGHFTYHINYDSSKPIYKYKPSDYSSVRRITSYEIQDGGHDWGFADSELEDPYFIRSNFPGVRIIGGRTLQLDDVSYTNNEAVFIGSEDGSISLKQKKPTYSLKKLDNVYNDNIYLFTSYNLEINNFNENYQFFYKEESFDSYDFTNAEYIEDLNLYYYKNDYYDKNHYKLIYKKDYINYLNDNDNNKIYKVFLNKPTTIIIKALDENNNYINSSSFIITSTENETSKKELPYLTINYKSTCKTNTPTYGEINTCVNYEINSHITDEFYNLYMSVDNSISWEKLDIYYPGFYEFTATKNGYYKFIIKDSNENIIDIKTITINSISEYSDLVKDNVYIEAKETFKYNEYGAYVSEVNYIFYNLNNNHKVYYSEDSCPTNNEEYRVFPNAGMLTYSYNKDLNACIVVYDSNDVYITSLTYNFVKSESQIYYDNNSVIDQMFSYIKNSSKNGFVLFNYISIIWKNILNFKIGSYIMLLIVTSIIILILKSLNR